jgi:hypothetical protein
VIRLLASVATGLPTEPAAPRWTVRVFCARASGEAAEAELETLMHSADDEVSADARPGYGRLRALAFVGRRQITLRLGGCFFKVTRGGGAVRVWLNGALLLVRLEPEYSSLEVEPVGITFRAGRWQATVTRKPTKSSAAA